MDRLCLTIPDESYCWWNCSLYCKVHGVTLELYQQYSEDIQLTARINMELIWKCKCYTYCYISCISLVWTNCQRAARCTLFRVWTSFSTETFQSVLFQSTVVCFFLFLFPQFWELTFSAWLSDEEGNVKESCQLMVEKQQEICRGNYPSKKSP